MSLNENDFSAEYWNNYLYTDKSTIEIELKKRRCDSQLEKKVMDFWGGYAPEFLINQPDPLGFFSRPIITPNMETRFFVDISTSFHVKPLFLEFPDKFVSINLSKYHLAKIHRLHNARSGKTVVLKESLIDFNMWEGKPLRDILTKDDQKLHDVHTKMFLELYPAYKNNIIDISNWFERVRHAYDYYYLGYLALGIYHGVIFENFLMDDPKELDFFINKVAPSFKKVEEIFGMKPLISPVLPVTTAKLDQWYYYPQTNLDRW